MKITVDPSYFRRMLNNVLIFHGDVELDTNVGNFTPSRVEFRDVSLEIMSIYAVYNREFFIDYYATGEQIPLSKSILEQMKRGFGTGKFMSVYTADEKIHLEGETEHYEENLIEVAPADFPIEFIEDDILGLVPKNLNATVQIETDAEALTNLPKAEEYLFRCDGTKLEVIVEDVGKYTKTIVPNIERSMGELEVKFNAAYYGKVSSQFSGEVWISLNEDAAVFSQKKDSCMLTYMLGAL
ncbi:hypothetical protein KKF32_05345 [Patescibacteria group bacterium]|nr:hypothetical protein [Patescibacteria group bacterium]